MIILPKLLIAHSVLLLQLLENMKVFTSVSYSYISSEVSVVTETLFYTWSFYSNICSVLISANKSFLSQRLGFTIDLGQPEIWNAKS